MVFMNVEQLVELFQTAGQVARYAHNDIAEAMRVLYERNDLSGVRTFYDAYRRWNLLSVDDPYATEVALENLDTYAYIADLSMQGVPDSELASKAMAFSQEPVAPIGNVRAFYREAVQFTSKHPNVQ